MTLCSLVPRFYEVEEGSISVDGIDIRQVTQESLRRQIGIVQQDVFLFTGTLRENILYGKLDASEEEVWEAARRARLDEFIRAQEQGMDCHWRAGREAVWGAKAAAGDCPHVLEKPVRF